MLLKLEGFHLSASDIIRWTLATGVRTNPRRSYMKLKTICQKLRRALVQSCDNSLNLSEIFHQYGVTMDSIVAALFYRPLRLLALSVSFPSPSQRAVWCISACVVTGALPILSGMLIGVRHLDTDEWTRLDTPVTYAVIFSLLYGFLRSYSLVECFINLSHLPVGVYKMPE